MIINDSCQTTATPAPRAVCATMKETTTRHKRARTLPGGKLNGCRCAGIASEAAALLRSAAASSGLVGGTASCGIPASPSLGAIVLPTKTQKGAGWIFATLPSTEVERPLAVRRALIAFTFDATDQPQRIDDQHLSRAVRQPNGVSRMGKCAAEHLERQNQIATQEQDSAKCQRKEATIGERQATRQSCETRQE